MITNIEEGKNSLNTSNEKVVKDSPKKELSVNSSVPTTPSQAMRQPSQIRKIINPQSSFGFGKICYAIVDLVMNINDFDYRIYKGRYLTLVEAEDIYNELDKNSR